MNTPLFPPAPYPDPTPDEVDENGDDKLLKLLPACEFLKSIPNINSGGCGIAALALKRYASIHLPELELDYAFLYLEVCEPDFYSNLERIKNGQVPGIVPEHIALFLGEDLFLDSDFVTTSENYYFFHSGVLERDLLCSINYASSWCRDFDRSLVPNIADHLGVDLSDVRLRWTT